MSILTKRKRVSKNSTNNGDVDADTIGGIAVSGSPTTNQVMLFDGTDWEPTTLAIGTGLPSTLLSTTSTNTVTNKDMSSGTNTFPTSLVTLTGTQELTNKTITSGVLVNPTINGTEVTDTVATTSTVQTLTNKVLEDPEIYYNTFEVTFPSGGPNTLISRNSTDTLSGKTFSDQTSFTNGITTPGNKGVTHTGTLLGSGTTSATINQRVGVARFTAMPDIAATGSTTLTITNSLITENSFGIFSIIADDHASSVPLYIKSTACNNGNATVEIQNGSDTFASSGPSAINIAFIIFN